MSIVMPMLPNVCWAILADLSQAKSGTISSFLQEKLNEIMASSIIKEIFMGQII